MSFGPRRIVCLTEEPTEVLYALGEQDRIVGISGFTVRPARARKEKPKVSAFTSAKIDEILKLEPDFVVGFSDIQADIAAELVRRGVEVWMPSQIGAWASLQSQTLPSRDTFEARVAAFEKKFEGGAVPRPPHWSGFRVVPERIEFWYGARYRLHDRHHYEHVGGTWTKRLLYP